MTYHEPRTVADFVGALIAERGGRACFSTVQVRICHTVALALRDPQKVDPATVSRLIDLLPPRPIPPEQRAPIPELVFCDHYSLQLERVIDACPDDDPARAALVEAQARVVALENENTALHHSVQALRDRVERDHVPEGVDTRQRKNRMGDSPNGNATHANVVPIHPIHGSPHSLTVERPLEQRYPLKHLDPVL
jgi:hypothetical protein